MCDGSAIQRTTPSCLPTLNYCAQDTLLKGTTHTQHTHAHIRTPHHASSYAYTHTQTGRHMILSSFSLPPRTQLRTKKSFGKTHKMRAKKRKKGTRLSVRGRGCVRCVCVCNKSLRSPYSAAVAVVGETRQGEEEKEKKASKTNRTKQEGRYMNETGRYTSTAPHLPCAVKSSALCNFFVVAPHLARPFRALLVPPPSPFFSLSLVVSSDHRVLTMCVSLVLYTTKKKRK